MNTKLAIGTVQFGTAYGINNKTGQVPEKQVVELLARAYAAGVNIVDTAQAYGESEYVLGRVLPALNKPFRVVSKFIAGPGLTPDALFSDTCARLKVKRLYAFLYHKFSDFQAYPDWHEKLLGIKAKGSLDKIGFSVYYPHEIQFLLDNNVKFDLVQLPYSVFDRRFEVLFPALKERGVEVHVRSVFLQGLAFTSTSNLPAYLERMRPRIELINSISRKVGIPVVALCLCFAYINPCIDKVVIGLDGIGDLESALDSIKWKDEVVKICSELSALKENNEMLILPHNWGK